LADLKLELIDSLLHADDVLLKASLFGLKLCELLLKASSLGLLVRVVTLDLFFNTVELIG
jgi:hypothetical protein